MNKAEKKPVVMVTGTTGFIGKYLLETKGETCDFRPVSLCSQSPEALDFRGVDAVLHLAGLAHQMQKTPDHLYFDINTRLTARLADAAKSARVPHFLFVSTIKVFGEHNKVVLTENTPCNPRNDPYGESKLKAEQYLQSIQDETFKVAIVRPPLVYGPGVKGNLIRFLALADSPYPLPFGAMNNRRSMVSLDNLTALLTHIIDSRSGGLFLASDPEPISTTSLMKTLRKGLGRPERLFSLPAFFIQIIRFLRPELGTRLFGSLEIDASDTTRALQLAPQQSTETGLLKMAAWYKSL